MTRFHQIATEKGWRLVDIGQRWGVSERQMSRIANNPTQKDLDAAKGLPRCRRTRKKKTRHASQPPQNPKPKDTP